MPSEQQFLTNSFLSHSTVRNYIICGLSLHHGDTESRKSLEQKFITRWSYINSLLMNPDKTRLFVGVPQLLRSLPALPLVMLSEQGIKPVPFTRDHITELDSSCIFRLSRINRIKHLRDRKTVIFLINAFVFSTWSCSTVPPYGVMLPNRTWTSSSQSRTLLVELSQASENMTLLQKALSL